MATLVHVLVNDYVIDSIYIALSFVFTGVVEGHVHDLVHILHQDLWATIMASWCTSLVFIPVEFVCFGYLDVALRVLAMNVIDLLWGAIISFVSHRTRREGVEQEALRKVN